VARTLKLIGSLVIFYSFGFQLSAQTLDSKTFSRVFRQVRNSVVSISVSITRIVDGQPKTVASGGSGVIISQDGQIITNKHVVSEQTRTFRVTLAGGPEFNASFVGMAPDTDLSLIKLDSLPQGGLEPMPLGDSSNVEEGDWVLAIGSPFGLGGTLTVGIVSTKERIMSVPTENGTTLPHPLIQTDAAINPGNSGGALVNLNGELIGVPTMILSGTGTNAGVGFAIPSNVVKKVISDIINKKTEIGWLGMLVQNVGEMFPTVKKQLGINTENGVVITAFEPNNQSEKAGLKQYDTIVSIDGQSVNNVREFKWVERNLSPGGTALLKIYPRKNRDNPRFYFSPI